MSAITIAPTAPHCPALRGRGHADEDRAQHQEDQRQRWNHHKRDPLGQLREQSQLEDPVDDGDDKRRQAPDQHGQNDALVHGRRLGLDPVADEVGADGRQHHQHQQRAAAARAVGFMEGTGLRRQGGCAVGLDQRHHDHVDDVGAGQDEARQDGTAVHVADRSAELIGQDDEHQRGRDDLRERAGRRDDARRKTAVVAVAQHDGQRDQPHRDDRSRDHAGRGRQHGAHQHDGDGQAALDRTEELSDGLEQILGHARSLEDQAHQREEGNGQQRVVGDDAEDPLRQGLEECGRQQSQFDAHQGIQDAVGGQRKGDRETQQQERHQGGEHDRGEIGGKEFHGLQPS